MSLRFRVLYGVIVLVALVLVGGSISGLMRALAEGHGHGPKNFPLQCFDCHFPHDLVDEPQCFSCHGSGGAPELDCFDCHGRHQPNRPPDLSDERNCFRCHEGG